jgi:hypothetical protein
MSSQSRTIAFALGLVLFPGGSTPARAASEAADDGWLQQTFQAIADGEYDASPRTTGFDAPNRQQNLRTTFRCDGVEIRRRVEASGESDWGWTWRTTAWGREDALTQVTLVPPSARGPRVEYRRAAMTEWYLNTRDGIEQGFSIAEAPPGEGRLCVEGLVTTDLRPLAAPGRRAIDFADARGDCVLRYGELVVLDARGRALEAAMRLDGSALRIEIDDRGARYPLTVDPLMSSPAWTAEGNLASAQLGFSVATAGDVNGDGYCDAIVGAPAYSNGAGESAGRVFVYLGSPSGLAAAASWSARPGALRGLGEFGEAVGPAGDVNGDGYDDIVVGAPEFGSVGSEGTAFVWLGGPSGGGGGASGLGASGTEVNADWTGRGDQVQALFGRAVGTAGDVNGDGFDDILVGAPGYDGDEGEVFVWLGSPDDLGASGTPANADWRTVWTEANSTLGWSVATAGDVNADGYSDIIAGVPLGSNGQVQEGGAFVWLGAATGLGPSGTPSNADWYCEANQASAQLGASVGPAGDVDGDGYSDVIVGAPGYDSPTADEGAAFIWLGGPSDLGANGSPANAGWSAEGNQAGANFGQSVFTAGDVTGDGFADVVVGAPSFDAGQANEGRAYLYMGSGLGPDAAAAWVTEGNQADAAYGQSIATVGDVNGDGFSDVIVGAWLYDAGQVNEGRAFVYHGGGDRLETVAAWVNEGNQADAQFGQSVACAGDVNGDGYSDVIVGAPMYDNGQGDEGRVFVYAGQPVSPTVNPIWTAESNQAGAHFGFSVASAGDVNGDGYSDVTVGAPEYESDAGEAGEGAVFLWFGGESGLGSSGTPSNADWSAESDQAGGAMGYSVARAGDVNGDGYGDIVAGIPFYDGPDVEEGRVVVFHGSATGPSADPDWAEERDQATAHFGWSVASAGDVNGDGFSDVIAGAPLYTGSHILEGRAWVFHGSTEGLSPVANWFADMDQEGASLGISVAGAGDVNGDGYSDVIVGAWAFDGAGGSETGLAAAYHGSENGLGAEAWSVEGSVPETYLGYSVASAGDVNGDGYSDVIVGGWGYSNGEDTEGGAWAFGGSAAGLSTAPSWSAESDQADARMGFSVAPAGDVTGDGFSDVIVGAFLYDEVDPDEGRVFLHYGNGINGLDRAARQSRSDGSAPIDLLGASDAEDAFRLKVRGRSAAGRDRVQMEWEVKPLGDLLDGTALGTGSPFDTGAPNAQGSVVEIEEPVNGLAVSSPHHWRLRIRGRSPYFPRSPWFALAYNAPNETDLRTAAPVIAVEHSSAPGSALTFAPGRPNPFAAEIRIAYSLGEAARVQLAIFDAQGRFVTALDEGVRRGGEHVLVWDGRNRNGVALPPGVYFVRLLAGGTMRSQKIALTR